MIPGNRHGDGVNWGCWADFTQFGSQVLAGEVQPFMQPLFQRRQSAIS